MILAADCKSVGKCQVATDEFDSYISHSHTSMPRWRAGLQIRLAEFDSLDVCFDRVYFWRGCLTVHQTRRVRFSSRSLEGVVTQLVRVPDF